MASGKLASAIKSYRVFNFAPNLDDRVVIVLATRRVVEDRDDGAGLSILYDGRPGVK